MRLHLFNDDAASFLFFLKKIAPDVEKTPDILIGMT